MKHIIKTLGLAALLGFGAPAFAGDPFKIGFIVPNPVGEVGWDHERYLSNKLSADFMRRL